MPCKKIIPETWSGPSLPSCSPRHAMPTTPSSSKLRFVWAEEPARDGGGEQESLAGKPKHSQLCTGGPWEPDSVRTLYLREGTGWCLRKVRHKPSFTEMHVVACLPGTR